jgi:hypothetical protein
MHVILRLLLAQIFSAGLSRCQLKPADRTPVNIYVDEFQNFVSDNMASMLSEARKFGLRFALANQTLAQLSHQTDLRGDTGERVAIGFPTGRMSGDHLSSLGVSTPGSLNDNRSLPCQENAISVLAVS